MVIMINLSRSIKIFLQISVSSLLCIRKDDNFISAELEESGGWEEDIVTRMMEVVHLYPEATFVGILNVDLKN